MTLTQSLYARRNGPMLFWRIGRLGGSIYLAACATPRVDPETKAYLKAELQGRRKALRLQAKMARYWHRAWERLYYKQAVGRA